MFDKFSSFFASIPFEGNLVWVYLALACTFEIMWAFSLKMTDGFTHMGWTLATIPFALISTLFLALSMKGMPMGIAYAIWTGAGTVGTVILGMMFFREPVDVLRIACIALIFCGIAGLKITTSQG